jgi:hypothetical protein
MNPNTCIVVDDEPKALSTFAEIIERHFAGRVNWNGAFLDLFLHKI